MNRKGQEWLERRFCWIDEHPAVALLISCCIIVSAVLLTRTKELLVQALVHWMQ